MRTEQNEWIMGSHSVYKSQILPAEISQETRDNSVDDIVAAAASVSSQATPAASSTRKKQKFGIIIEEKCLSQALNFISRVPDDYDKCGEHMAMQMRSLSSDTYRKMLKREVQQYIAHVPEPDDFNCLSTSITSEVTEAPPSGP